MCRRMQSEINKGFLLESVNLLRNWFPVESRFEMSKCHEGIRAAENTLLMSCSIFTVDCRLCFHDCSVKIKYKKKRIPWTDDWWSVSGWGHSMSQPWDVCSSRAFGLQELCRASMLLQRRAASAWCFDDICNEISEHVVGICGINK